MTYNGVTQSVTGFTVTGLVNGETKDVLTGVTSLGTGIAPGVYVSKASGIDQNYALTFIDGKFQINPAIDNGAVIRDVVVKASGTMVISELKVLTICEPASGTYTNLVSLKTCQ